jgi:hypothetical protein
VWLHLEPTGARFALDDLERPAALLPAPVSQVLAAVGGIGPDLLEPRHAQREAR